MRREELTWKDIKRIVEIADKMMETYTYPTLVTWGQELFYTEVLKRFKEKEK